MTANTGMCVRHGVPPAGHGSTFLLLPVGRERKENISEDHMMNYIRK